MKREICIRHIVLLFVINMIGSSFCAMTAKQLEKSLDMMRSVCAPKFPLTPDQLNGLRKGVFDDNNKDLKCYTLCIAQMAGTMTKKNELSIEKAIKQLEAMAPAELKDIVVATAMKCKDVQKGYKDPCDRTYYTVKCSYDVEPVHFIFP